MARERTRRAAAAKQPPQQPEPAVEAKADEEEEEDVFDVEMIVDKRESPKKGAEYYVKWKGYPNTSNTWEPVANILQPKLIADFEKRRATKKEALVPKSTPIRGNLRFTPSPKPSFTSTPKLVLSPKATSKAAAAAKKQSKAARVVATAVKRRSLVGLPVKNQRTRKAAPAKATKRKAADIDEDKDEQEKEESEGNEEHQEEQDENGTDPADDDDPLRRLVGACVPADCVPVKAKRARTAKTKPVSVNGIAPEPVKPKSLPAKKAASRTKKETKPAEQLLIEDSPERSDELFDFTKFTVSQVINEKANSKMITFQGTYNNETAVVRLEKTLFDEDAVKQALGDKKTIVDRDFANDVYSSYNINPVDSATPLNDIKATVVWPANETVIAKYSHSETIFFSETPDVYSKVVEPFIDNKLSGDKDYNNWVYNILDGKSEVDRVILNDPDPDSGFMIIPDLKSSGHEKDVYLLAICHRRDIRSLRDLNDQHLILLKNIMTKGTKAIKDKYKKNKNQLRAYIHYHPSFYHFHVHFKMVDASDYPSTDRDNLLGTVINNISLMKDYYKKSTLAYPLAQSHALYQELKKAKRI